MGTEIWAWETMMRTPWCSAHHLDLFQPLLDHGPWADAKEPSSGGGPWAEYPCLGQESFTFSECLHLRDAWPRALGDHILEWPTVGLPLLPLLILT